MLAALPTPLLFDCEGERLVGLLHGAAGETGVVVIVGGPQYRAGSHRHFVQLAQALSAAGFPVLRFDSRGMGDSTGPLHNFEQITPDISAAIDALTRHQPQVGRVVLWGLCDAASAAMLYLSDRVDPRVAGLCLANPWVRSSQTLAQARVRHYYLKRLSQKDFWLKLLRGGVALRGAAEMARNIARSRPRKPTQIMSFQQRMLVGWRAFPGPRALLLSADDLTAMEFKLLADQDPDWIASMKSCSVELHEMVGADHTFSRLDSGLRAIDWTLAWLRRVDRDARALSPDPAKTMRESTP